MDSKASLIHKAAKRGDYFSVKKLVESGVSVDSRYHGDLTPLHFAAAEERFLVTQYLLEMKADPNAKDNSLRTPLHYSSRTSQTDIARLLLKNGALINAESTDGFTAISEACCSQQWEMVKLLWENGALLSPVTKKGHTLLHLSVFPIYLSGLYRSGPYMVMGPAGNFFSENIFFFLVGQGLEINARDNFGRTLLNLAILHSAPQGIIDFLKERGAELSPPIEQRDLRYLPSNFTRLDPYGK